jgi:hypothetical protein
MLTFFTQPHSYTISSAKKSALLEEELLASEDGFRQDYSDCMLRTGRFLPRLRRET